MAITEADQIRYTNYLGKTREVPVAVAQHETQQRLNYLETFVPRLKEFFDQRGLKVEIETVGSVADGAANPDSDIDLRVAEIGATDLNRTLVP